MISQRGASCVVSSTAAFTSMASNWPSAASGLANDWNLALRWASSYSSPGNSFCTDASTSGSAGTLGQLGAQTLARGALAGAVLAVQDVAFQLLVMVRLHEGALHEILHVLHRDGAAFALLRARHRALDARDEAFGLLVVQNRAHAGEGRAHGALDLAGLVGFHGAVALGKSA